MQNSLIIDNANIPVLSAESLMNIPVGEFVDTPLESSHPLDDSLVVGQWRDMYLPNFSLRVFEGTILQDAVFMNMEAKGTDLLGSCIFFKANIKSTLAGQDEGVDSFSREQNFKFDPNNEFRHKVTANTDLHYIHFSYTPEYLDQFLPDESWADELRSRIYRKERIMGEKSKPLTLNQEQAWQNILNCPLRGKLGTFMIETSILQIILIHLNTLFGEKEVVTSNGYSRQDAETMVALKEYLSGSFLEDHSMLTLSRQFGMNSNKLMSLFKKFYGKSIFEYISELRMEHARQLLLEKAFRVVEVARALGYKNPNHFSAAFKRHYGIIPSEIRCR